MARLTMVDLLARIEQLEQQVEELKAQAPQQPQLSAKDACALHASMLEERRAKMAAAREEAMRTGRTVRVQ